MNLLPAFAPTSNIADLFTRPLPTISHHRHRFDTLIGDTTTITPSTSVATATVDPSTLVAPTVDSSAVTTTVVASASGPTATTVSDSVPLVLDTGTSRPVPRSRSDFALEITQASYGLIRSAFDTSVAYSYSKVASTPVDPYTLITGEDAIDLSSPDTTSDSEPSFTKVSFDICEFGTATLTFIYSKSSSELLHIFVDPNQIDWLHWIPLPRLTPTESYFHIFGRDYLQAITFFHLIPIWIYFLVHFVVNLED